MGYVNFRVSEHFMLLRRKGLVLQYDSPLCTPSEWEQTVWSCLSEDLLTFTDTHDTGKDFDMIIDAKCLVKWYINQKTYSRTYDRRPSNSYISCGGQTLAVHVTQSCYYSSWLTYGLTRRGMSSEGVPSWYIAGTQENIGSTNHHLCDLCLHLCTFKFLY